MWTGSRILQLEFVVCWREAKAETDLKWKELQIYNSPRTPCNLLLMQTSVTDQCRHYLPTHCSHYLHWSPSRQTPHSASQLHHSCLQGRTSCFHKWKIMNISDISSGDPFTTTSSTTMTMMTMMIMTPKEEISRRMFCTCYDIWWMCSSTSLCCIYCHNFCPWRWCLQHCAEKCQISLYMQTSSSHDLCVLTKVSWLLNFRVDRSDWEGGVSQGLWNKPVGEKLFEKLTLNYHFASSNLGLLSAYITSWRCRKAVSKLPDTKKKPLQVCDTQALQQFHDSACSPVQCCCSLLDPVLLKSFIFLVIVLVIVLL